MKKLYFNNQVKRFSKIVQNHFNYKWVLTILLLLFFSNPVFAQKNKDIEPVITCVKDLGNGLYQASFGYINPTNN
jgi:hypothetical protein